MTDGEDSATQEVDAETEETAEAEAETEREATLDVEAAREREETVEALREQVADQREQIEELEDIMLDMSTRVADDGGTGVCPDCHGPVIKSNPFLRRAKVKCQSCGRVFHEY